VQQLLAKPGGGEAWLLSLRDKPYAEAHEALCSLPGVGPKVAACICLFSLDKVREGNGLLLQLQLALHDVFHVMAPTAWLL
jgi:hypothetical protein